MKYEVGAAIIDAIIQNCDASRRQKVIEEGDGSTEVDTEIGTEEALYGHTHGLDGADETDESDETDSDSMDLAGSIKKVNVQSSDITVYEYKRRLETGRLRLDPDWQRSYVWKTNRASQFIESLLMGLPIPVIFIAENTDGKNDVIDGVQRLTTCYQFLSNEFKLSGLSVYKQLNGKYFKDLPSYLQNRMEESTITCFQVESSATQDMLFTIFERINSGGVRLNEMEIRNCIFRGKLNNKIKELANNEDFVEAVNSKNLSIRMDDRALVLRFLAFYYVDYRNAQGGIKRFLSEFLEDNRTISDQRLLDFETRFKTAMQSCVTVFGKHGFRVKQNGKVGNSFWATKINASLFQVISTSLARYPRPVIVKHADAILEEYIDLLHDEKFFDSVSRATGSPVQIRYSFEAWNNRLNKILETDYSGREPRIFSRQLKEELYYSNNECAICNNNISSIFDAHVDHIEHYWRGGKTIPENARLVHRVCNLSRAKSA